MRRNALTTYQSWRTWALARVQPLALRFSVEDSASVNACMAKACKSTNTSLGSLSVISGVTSVVAKTEAEKMPREAAKCDSFILERRVECTTDR